MAFGLHDIENRPFERTEHLPPQHLLRRHRLAAMGDIGGVELGPLAHATYRPLDMPEAPGAQADPTEILRRAAVVATLPIQHSGNAALVEDQVAHPVVAVDEPRRARRRPV